MIYKLEFIDNLQRVAEEKGRPFKTRSEAVRNYEIFLDTLKDLLSKEEKINFLGFGTFDVKQRKARIGRSPQHPHEKIEIPAYKAVTFKVGNAFKDVINERDRKNNKKK